MSKCFGQTKVPQNGIILVKVVDIGPELTHACDPHLNFSLRSSLYFDRKCTILDLLPAIFQMTAF